MDRFEPNSKIPNYVWPSRCPAARLERRFGLVHHDPHTLAEVAQHFHVTRERIRQIECMVLKKVRAQLKGQFFFFLADLPERRRISPINGSAMRMMSGWCQPLTMAAVRPGLSTR